MHPLREARLHYLLPALELLQEEGTLAALAAAGRPLRALDVGFGRGMNSAALLAWSAEAGRPVEVLGFEPAPAALEPWPRRPPRGAPFPWWGALPGSWASDGARVEVRAARLEDALADADGRFDLLLLDLFSPQAHAEAWSPALYAALARAAAPGAALATYTCARAVRDGLAGSGWQAEVLRRPGVRDTLRARRSHESREGGR